MDLILEHADHYALDAVYPVDMPRDSISRQITSITGVTLVGGYLLYLIGAGLAYQFWFDKELMNHPKFMKHQVKSEIFASLKSIPATVMPTLPWFLADARGYSKTYAEFGKYGYTFEAVTVVWFIFFSDMLVYWFHRWLHHPLIYAPLHKPHHKWIYLLAVCVARLPPGGWLHPEHLVCSTPVAISFSILAMMPGFCRWRWAPIGSVWKSFSSFCITGSRRIAWISASAMPWRARSSLVALVLGRQRLLQVHVGSSVALRSFTCSALILRSASLVRFSIWAPSYASMAAVRCSSVSPLLQVRDADTPWRAARCRAD